MKKLGNYLGYLCLATIVNFFSLFPLRFLYFLSDFFFLILFYGVGYRQKVISENLKRCFPNLSAEDLHSINQKFTRHLCDLIIEGLKGWSISEQALRERYVVKNPELLEFYASQGKSIILAGSHYNNWEWGVVLFNRLFSIPILGVFQPISNSFINQYLIKKRSRWGMGLMPAKNAVKGILQIEEQKGYLLLSDQSPSSGARPVWLNFFGQPTACLPGLSLVAIQGKMPILYYEVLKEKRGYYSLVLHTLVEDPSSETVDSIAQKYHKKLEKTIRKEPAYWLWSHKRWKRSPP